MNKSLQLTQTISFLIPTGALLTENFENFLPKGDCHPCFLRRDNCAMSLQCQSTVTFATEFLSSSDPIKRIKQADSGGTWSNIFQHPVFSQVHQCQVTGGTVKEPNKYSTTETRTLTVWVCARGCHVCQAAVCHFKKIVNPNKNPNKDISHGSLTAISNCTTAVFNFCNAVWAN